MPVTLQFLGAFKCWFSNFNLKRCYFMMKMRWNNKQNQTHLQRHIFVLKRLKETHFIRPYPFRDIPGRVPRSRWVDSPLPNETWLRLDPHSSSYGANSPWSSWNKGDKASTTICQAWYTVTSLECNRNCHFSYTIPFLYLPEARKKRYNKTMSIFIQIHSDIFMLTKQGTAIFLHSKSILFPVTYHFR